jgi:UDP-N-acetylmuramoyl-tripeptide--D-alanyl-D-alanine ligase
MIVSRTLAHLLAAVMTQPVTAGEWLKTPITDVVVDSRHVTPGSLFVALVGEKADGHDYVAEALQRGAVAALVEQDLVFDAECWILDTRAPVIQHSASLSPIPVLVRVENTLLALQTFAAHWRATVGALTSLRVVGITGSIGKTSTKEVVASVLGQRFPTIKSEGNLNNEIGLPLTLLRLTGAHRRAVLEMGMYTVGDIAMLCRLAQPHIGVVTNVGPVHLARAGSMERIAQGKAELVQALPPDGVAVLNCDDTIVTGMAQKTQAQVFTFGLDPSADVWANEVTSEGLEGIRFRLHYRREVLQVRVPLLGRHSVHTALAAVAVGLVEGLTWEEIVAGLQDVQAQLRLVLVPGIQGTTLLDDTYSASPAATLAALNLLADLPVPPGARRLAVLGDMLELGDYSETGHRKVGQRAADVVEVLVTVGPMAHWVAEEAVVGGMAPATVLAVDQNAEAVAALQQVAREGDLILIKGSRALHMEEIVTALSQPVHGNV